MNSNLNIIKITLNFFTKSLFPIVSVSFISLLLIALYSNSISPIIFAFFFVMFGLIGIILIFRKNPQKIQNAKKLFLYIFCANVIFVCALYAYYIKIYGLPYEYGGTDDQVFELSAYRLIDSDAKTLSDMKFEIMESVQASWNPAYNYIFLISAIHKTSLSLNIKPHSINPRLLNSFCLALISITVWQLALKIGCSDKASLFAGYFCGLFPHMVFESAHIYRDTIISLGIILSIYIFITLLKKGTQKNFLNIFLLVFIIFATASLRVNLIVIFFIISIAILLSWKFNFLTKGAIFLALFILLFTIMNVGHIFEQTSLFYTRYTQLRATQGIHGGIGTAIFNLPAYLSIPLRVIYASIRPLPFPTPILSENYHRIGTILWFFSLPFLFIALRHAFNLRYKIRYSLLRSLAIAFVILYLITSILTMQSRQSLMYIPLAIPLIVYGIEISKKSIYMKIAKMAILGAILFVLYLIFKFF